MMWRQSSRPCGPLVTRRRLQVALGILWLIDGILQLQPQMFTPEFYGMMLRMAPIEAPGWLWDLQTRVEPLLTHHSVAANATFASLQILLGLGLLWRRTTRLALTLSVAWGLAVWLVGEGAGGLFSPGASALTGAPGAALVYAVVAVNLWPGDPGGYGGAPARLGRDRLSDLSWLALWVGTAALELGALNRTPWFAGSAISNAANEGPSWLSSLDHAFGGLVGTSGVPFALCAGLLQAGIGLGICFHRTRAVAIVAGVVLVWFYGLVGQDLGGVLSQGPLGIFHSGATDVGIAPAVTILALCLWPRDQRVEAHSPSRPSRLVLRHRSGFEEEIAPELGSARV